MKRFKNLESLTAIEKPSLASKSTSDNFSKGLWAEKRVQHLMKKQGWTLLGQRQKCPYGEVDLIFQKNNKVALIEVKFLHNEWMVFQRVSALQRQRLQKNLVYFQNHLRNFQVQLFIAFVNSCGQIKWSSVD